MKIIGVASRYVTYILGEGPVMGQDIIRISHKDSVERRVLARTLRFHPEDRVLVHGRKTVVFD